MSFVWPWMLLGLVAVPLAVLWYRRLLRARAERRARLAAIGLVAPASASGRRRHIPPVLLLVALALMLVALARPEAVVPQPRQEGTVILAFDVSSSMAATDITPSRIEAAKVAARAFVDRQPPTVRVGVVAFSGSGLVTQEATADRAVVLAAIDRLAPHGGTALARGLQTSLSAVAGKPVLVDEGGAGSIEPQGPDLGYHGSAAIILLSDGENTDDPDPIEVAEIASSAGVRVYPIGIGSPDGTVLEIDGFQVATALDEPMLRDIATRTDGRYFPAADERALAAVYDSIELEWTVEAEHIEITALVAAAAAVLVLLGVALSVTWFGRAV
ncbi:vWA domain-containing protein [Pseudonocardia sp. TRM90224]|uniref:vWA domain-containing protein n=1 Tax=Pseudonocardia sp. TRM90224 TaxID=2812678 RepID=UPI001E424C16|nr:VWA domain-containing protein [Pseudonocardia sp. TRM90224]